MSVGSGFVPKIQEEKLDFRYRETLKVILYLNIKYVVKMDSHAKDTL